MEQKKLLLVAISVGVFLSIAIGAALVVFKPQNTAVAGAVIPPGSGGTVNVVETVQTTAQTTTQEPAETAATETGKTIINPADYLKNPEMIQGIQTPPAGLITAVETPLVTVTVEPAASSASPRDTVSSASSSAASVAAVSATTASASSASPSAASATTAATTATSTTQVVSTSAQTTQKTAASSAAQSSAPPAAASYYWVQAGSFTAVSRAESVKDTLADWGITSIIENREVQGTSYFRVRVGPYNSRSEANYWLVLIQSISGFEDSQIWTTQSRS